MTGRLAAVPLWAALATAPLSPAAPTPFQLIVNSENPVGELPSGDVARLFLRTTRTWRHGVPAQPVDQSLSSPVRMQFVKDVLGQTRGEVQEYWLKRMFSGREVPPPVRESDTAVIEYVRANSGAIGYVDPAVALPNGVKTLRVVQ